MSKGFLEGERLFLRPFQEDDIDTWFRWFNDADVTRHMEQGRFPNTAHRQREYLQRLSASTGDIQLAIIANDECRLIGTVGLHTIDYINRNADLSIVIGEKAHWGNGLGTEAIRLMLSHAFGALNLHKITSGMVANNEASARAFLRLGFRREGLMREQVFLNGAYCDVIRLGLLKSDYVPSQARRA